MLPSLVVATIVLLTGCNPFTAHRSIGIEAADIASVEVYEYTWGENAKTVERLTIVNRAENREVIEEWVRGYTDMPVSPIGSDAGALATGEDALGVKFILHDGQVVEVTRVFVWYHDVIVIWQDGTVNHTEWGAPDLLDYYREFGTVERVDASERPHAVLPER